MRDGIDCSARVTKAVATSLVALGHTFVARYLVPSGYTKWLSPEEAIIISAAGLDILSVFETTASRALSGTLGGKADGASALSCARNVKQPSGTAIYFAVDFDVTKPEQLDDIEEYLKACKAALGTAYNVGVYGELTVIDEMHKRGAAKHFWQTYAWSNGKKSDKANVYQFKNGQSLAGITVDLNNSFGGEGFWSLRADNTVGKPRQTKFTDVPGGHWAEQAIGEANATGMLTGVDDDTFGLGQPLTREQMAIIISRMESRYARKEVK